MKAILFHFMNAFRIPIMFVTKFALWIAVLLVVLAWCQVFGWVENQSSADPLVPAIAFLFIAAGIYYFRWKYDILLVRLNPTKQGVAVSQGDSHIFGAGGNDSAIIGKE